MYHGGFFTRIAANPLLEYQMVLVTAATIMAVGMMFKKEIGLKIGIVLAAMYIASIIVQFLLPKDLSIH